MSMIASQTLSNSRPQPSEEKSLLPLVIYSLIFHLLVFFVLPLVSKLFWKPDVFTRPHTFQLVIPPPIKQSRPAAPQPVAEPPQTQSAQTPPPQAQPAKPKPQPKSDSQPMPRQEVEQTQPAVEEDLDELADLLENLPAPARAQSLDVGFTWDYYIIFVQQKIEKFWNPPLDKREVAAIVAFKISRAGEIQGLHLSKSSGKATLDNLALRAVTLAGPFGKLPPQYQGEALEMQVTLRPVKN